VDGFCPGFAIFEKAGGNIPMWSDGGIQADVRRCFDGQQGRTLPDR